MIDLTMFLLCSPMTAEPIAIQDDLQTEIELISPDELKQEKDPGLNPNAFMLLLSQMLSTLADQSVKEPTPEHCTNVDASEAKPSPLSANETTPQVDVSQEPADLMTQNVAMTWINSSGYEPPEKVDGVTSETKNLASFDILDDVADASPLLNQQERPNQIKLKSVSVNNSPILSIKNQNELAGSLFTKQSDLLTNFKPGEEKQTSTLIESMVDHLPSALVQLTDASSSIPLSVAMDMQGKPSITLDTPVKTLSIPIEINDPQWATEFSEHIVWLGQQNITSAIIRIHPEDLGPLEITIKMNKDSAVVDVVGHNSQALDLVDQSVPILREMMAEQGVNLIDVQVSVDDNNRKFTQQTTPSEEVINPHLEEETFITPLGKRPTVGLIDYFA